MNELYDISSKLDGLRECCVIEGAFKHGDTWHLNVFVTDGKPNLYDLCSWLRGYDNGWSVTRAVLETKDDGRLMWELCVVRMEVQA